MTQRNRYSEENVKPSTLHPTQGIDWTHDPRSESSHELHEEVLVKEPTLHMESGLKTLHALSREFSDFHFSWNGRVLTITGSVESRAEKVLIETILRKNLDLSDLSNQLVTRESRLDRAKKEI